MPSGFKGTLLRFVTFIGGLYFFLVFVLPKKLPLGKHAPLEIGLYNKEILKALQVLGVMAFGLAIVNVLMVHGPRVVKAQKYWRHSLALLLGLSVTLGVKFYDFYLTERAAYEKQVRAGWVKYAEGISALAKGGTFGETERALAQAQMDVLRGAVSKYFVGHPRDVDRLQGAAAEWENASQTFIDSVRAGTPSDIAAPLGAAVDRLQTLVKNIDEGNDNSGAEAVTVSRVSEFIENAFFIPLGAAMFSLLAFYIANAAYRAFRIRSIEAAIMMVAAVVVMLGQIPYGPLYIHPALPAVRLWLIETVSTPVFRAITFGSVVAGLAMAIRIWLSLDYYAGRRSQAGNADGAKIARGGE